MNFDLNINNYTKDELIDMFELPSNYNTFIFENKENKLRNNIINNKNIDKETKLKTLQFIVKAKNRILNNSAEDKNEVDSLKEKIDKLYNNNNKLQSSEIENIQEHMVQTRENIKTPYVNSYPSEFFAGVINPLKKRTIIKNLNIDTKFRENYFNSASTNFNFSLPINMNNVLQMRLVSIELPNTYYVVSKQYGNNYFTIIVNESTTVINIPDGNYDNTSIMTCINNQLLLAGSPFNNVNFVINLTNSTTGSCQTLVGFTNINDNNTNISLNFQADINGLSDLNTPLPLKFGWFLGFRNGIYNNNLNYVSEGCVDISGPKYIFLVVDDYNNNVNNNFICAYNSSILNKNILARISTQLNTFNAFNVTEQNNLNIITTPREYFGPVNIQSMNIQLLDEYGRVIDLNNMDYSFCINLTTVYDI